MSNTNTKLNNDVIQAIYITNNPYGSMRYMGSYSELIGTTNENQNEIAKIIDYRDKNVLVTGSSGDQYLSSVFFGSRKETIYDINVLAEYYIYLKICAFRNLKYDDFIEFILPFINKNKYFNKDILNQLSEELPTHVKDFWKLYLEEIDINKINNLIKFFDKDISGITKKVPYFDEKNFYKLQKLLKQKDYPKFIEADASYFEYYIKNTYDFITLSNIIECNQQPFDDVMETRLYTNEEWINYIKTVICKKLNPNGELLVYQTGDWYNKDYVKAGFQKHLIPSTTSKGKSNILVLKR